MSQPFVFITTHRIKSGQLDEFKARTRDYTAFVEANEPRLWAHFAYLDGDETEASLVTVHPDAASADHHLQAGESLGQVLELTETVGIEVYGDPGPVVRQALEANATKGVPVSVKAHGISAFRREPSAA